MRCILFVSELGGGRGHFARLSAVASIARSLNFRTVFAGRPSQAVKKQDKTHEFDEYEKSPVFPRLKNIPDAFKVSGLAASLAQVGFVDDRIITALVRQWLELIARYEPALIVGDFAPYARLASLGRVPFLMVGSGYTLPTSEGLLPFPQSSARRDPSQLVKHILKAMNESSVALSSKPIEDPSVCLRGDWNAVACVPLLDPAAGRHSEEYFGPFERFPSVREKSVSERTIYVYLHSLSEQNFKEIDALANAGYSIDMYCDGSSDGHPNQVSRLATPRSLFEIAENYGCVLHQGGLGLSTFCLQAAMLQLLNPKHAEAFMTSKKLRAHGCAAVLNAPATEQGKISPVSKLQQLLKPTSTKARRKTAVETRNWIACHDWQKRLQAILCSH